MMPRITTLGLVLSAFYVTVSHASDTPWSPPYPNDRLPPPSDSDHVWLHIDETRVRRSPTCTRPNEIWQGMGYNVTGFMKYNETMADWIASQGVNFVRLSFFPPGVGYVDSARHARFIPPTITTNQELIDDFIKPFTARFKKHGIYALLCNHSQAPAYKLAANGVDSLPPPYYKEEDLNKWVADWVEIAMFYKDEPWVLGYELLNEPSNLLMPNRVLREWTRRCIQAIREVDTNHIILAPGVMSGYVGGPHLLWECNGISWQGQDSIMSHDSVYRFGDPYFQTAIRYHRYLENKYVPPPGVYDWSEPGWVRFGYPLNTWVKYYQDTMNLCVFQTESSGKGGGPRDWWYSENRDEIKAQYWNWYRWFFMQHIEMCVGERDFWKDGPKANYFTGTVEAGKNPFTEPSLYKRAWEASIGETFDTAPEPYPTLDTCSPAGHNIPFVFHGIPPMNWDVTWEGWGDDNLTTIHDLEDGNELGSTKLLGWAAKKAGSPPPERCTNPPCAAAIFDSPPGKPARSTCRIHFYNNAVHFRGDISASLQTIFLYRQNGQIVYRAPLTTNRIPLPSLSPGTYILGIGDRIGSQRQKIFLH